MLAPNIAEVHYFMHQYVIVTAKSGPSLREGKKFRRKMEMLNSNRITRQNTTFQWQQLKCIQNGFLNSSHK